MLKIRAPLDRSSTLLKISHGIHAHSGAAGQPVNPDPEEFFLMGMTPEQKKVWERVKKIAKGPPDMPFREEIDIMDEYLNKARDEIFNCESILHAKGAILTWKLCRFARNAAVLASKVVDCAVLRLGSPDGISLQTTKQMLRTYVSVFVRMAEDTHHKKVTRKTTVSFLGAMQGVASISHILVQDTLALIGSEDTSLDYEIDDSDVNRAHLEYQVEMNNLKDKLTTAHPADVCELLEPTVHDAMICTEVYIRKMTLARNMAIPHM